MSADPRPGDRVRVEHPGEQGTAAAPAADGCWEVRWDAGFTAEHGAVERVSST